MRIGRRKLAAVMFTDIVGYSALTHRDEMAALEQVNEHRKILRPLFEKFLGREIRTIGDAFFVEFESTIAAVECAVRIQEALKARNDATSGSPAIRVRIGIHLGDVIETEDSGYDIYGDGVNIAARLQFLANPGGICFSKIVYDQVFAKIDRPITRAGERKLKNIASPVAIYRIDFDKIPRSHRTLILSGRNLRKRHWIAMASAVPLLLGAVAFFQSGGLVTQESRLAESSAHPKRIAILPVRNETGNVEDEFLTDGLTDELISNLSQIKQIRVLARPSVQPYKASTKTARQIGSELGVTAVLTGSLRKSGNQIRVSVQLIDSEKEETLWSDSYDTPIGEIFEVQRKIGARISSQFKGRGLASIPSLHGKSITPHKDAYLLYLKGRQLINRRSEEALNKAVDFFNQAIALDPSYAPHHVGASNAIHLLAYYGYISPRDALTREHKYTDSALELSQESAEALTARASRRLYYYHDWKASEEDYVRALELQPSLNYAYQGYGTLLMALGRFDEGERAFKQASELDPLSLSLMTTRAFPDYFRKHYEQAIAKYRMTLELDPNFLPAQWGLGKALTLSGRTAESIEILERASKISDGAPTILGTLGWAYAKAGRTVEARKTLSRLHELSRIRYVSSYNMAAIHLALNEKKEAYAFLEKALEERSVHLVEARIDPVLDSIRAEPKFQQLLGKLGLSK